jgi:hypothetical protein
MKKFLFTGFIFLIGIIPVSAQKIFGKNAIKAAPPVCYASGKVEKVAIPPSPELLNKLKSGVQFIS